MAISCSLSGTAVNILKLAIGLEVVHAPDAETKRREAGQADPGMAVGITTPPTAARRRARR